MRLRCKQQGCAGDQWDAERRVIQRIQDKLNFTRNPRFQDTVPPTVNTATMDPLLNRPPFGVGSASKASKPSLTSQPNTSFVCEPEAVRFTDWQPGHVYQATVQACLADTATFARSAWMQWGAYVIQRFRNRMCPMCRFETSVLLYSESECCPPFPRSSTYPGSRSLLLRA